MKKKHLLLPLLIYSFFSISITYATYRFKTNGSGSIENASWDVSLIGNEDDIELISGNNEQAYLITVNNNSEVDITYSITITDLPDNVKVKLDNGEYIKEVNNKVVFEDVGTILYTQGSKNHTLTFTAPLDTEEIESQDFNINVEFKQS